MEEKCRLCGQDDPTINAVKLSTAEARADSAERELALLRRHLTQKKTEFAAFKQELADLKETKPEFWDQCIADQICFYRNLAIRYGAKPDDMDNEWDVGLAAHQEELVTEIASLKADNAGLKGVVEKVSTTRDGVPIGRGDEVWFLFPRGQFRKWIYSQGPVARFPNPWGTDEDWEFSIEEGYSTREKAEQARPDRDVPLGRLAAGGQGEGAEEKDDGAF